MRLHSEVYVPQGRVADLQEYLDVQRAPLVEHSRDRLNVLFLIPHPFYEDRGSPIADSLLLRVLSERGEHIDAVAYPQGKDIFYDNVTLYRTAKLPLGDVRPGFSWKKLVYDVLMLGNVLGLMATKRYHLIHAVEETAFIALLLKLVFRIPYVYDMDSSLAQQMVEKYPSLGRFSGLFRWFEGIAVRYAEAVVPVCRALADDIARYRPRRVTLLPDVSLLESGGQVAVEDVRSLLNIKGTMLMYVGNLESYQGIDLLLDSFALAMNQTDAADLVIIGGEPGDIDLYQRKAHTLGIHEKVHFLGKKPANCLGAYLAQADVLVSPRTKGKNTPMKIYSYLDSGKAVLATDLFTHTQVLTDRVALLAPPSPEAFANGMVQLVGDKTLRSHLGAAGKQLIREHYSYEAFQKQANDLYDWLRRKLLHSPGNR